MINLLTLREKITNFFCKKKFEKGEQEIKIQHNRLNSNQNIFPLNKNFACIILYIECLFQFYHLDTPRITKMLNQQQKHFKLLRNTTGALFI